MSKDWVFVRLGADKEAQKEAQRGGAKPAAPQPPAADAPPSAWAEAVLSATDKTLATEWAARVEGNDLLADLALKSRFADIRLGAARRISDLAVLRRIAEATKDKHVHRHAAEALKASRQESTRARRSAELAAQVRALTEAPPIAINHLLEIEKELASLGKGGEETAECEALLAAAREQVLQETQAQIEMRGLLASAEALLVAVRTAVDPTPEQLVEFSAQHGTLVEAASAAPQWLRAIPAARNFVKALEEVENRVHAFGDAIEKVVLEEDRKAAEAEARQAAEEEAKRTAGDAAKAQAKKKIDHEAIDKLLGEFEAHLEEGRVAEAEAASKGIDKLLGAATPPAQVLRRLQRARAQKDRLAGWARWGTDKAREQLIAEAEALLAGEPDIGERARAVPLLRREWKNLDAHGGAAQALWKRFDKALEAAYKPVAEQRAIEAAAQEAARAARTAMLEEWEAWYPTAGGDFKALDAKREAMSQQWRSAPRAGFGDERKLRKRFDALLAKIDKQLDEARKAESIRLEDLVTQAEALKDQPDLGAAMNAAKTLQRRWKEDVTGVRLRHGEDQKFWRRFRSACDAVFARRDAENAERDAERAKRDQEREAAQEAAREAERKKKEKQAARFAEMAQKAAAAASAAAPEALEKGRSARDALLLDLEISLDLPTPESHAAQRRARNLSRLQERFNKNVSAPLEPEAMVKQWYAIPAAEDEGHAARIAAVVERLLALQQKEEERKQRQQQERRPDRRPERGADRGQRPQARTGFPRRDSRS